MENWVRLRPNYSIDHWYDSGSKLYRQSNMPPLVEVYTFIIFASHISTMCCRNVVVLKRGSFKIINYDQ